MASSFQAALHIKYICSHMYQCGTKQMQKILLKAGTKSAADAKSSADTVLHGWLTLTEEQALGYSQTQQKGKRSYRLTSGLSENTLGASVTYAACPYPWSALRCAHFAVQWPDHMPLRGCCMTQAIPFTAGKGPLPERKCRQILQPAQQFWKVILLSTNVIVPACLVVCV